MEEDKKTEEVVVVDKHGKRHKGVVDLFNQTDDIFSEQVGGFKHFLQEFAVVGLAAGFIIGSQGSNVMKSLVDAFLNPLVEFLFGENLSSRTAIVHHHQQVVKIPWGNFVYALVQLFFVLVTLYIFIKVFRLDRFTGKKVVKQKRTR